MTLLDDLAHAHRVLRHADTIGMLFCQATRLASEVTGFERSLIATVLDGQLSAAPSAALADQASDAMRRRLAATPVALRPGTEESELVRRGRNRSSAGTQHSDLADLLGLECWAASPVAPEESTLALVVIDRDAPEVGEADRVALRAFTAVLGTSLEHFVLRRRAAELAEEVRQFAGSAQALAKEVLDAPVAVPVDHGLGLALPRPTAAGDEAPDAMAMLSTREQSIAQLLITGRSNREIAEVLVLSPETVKSHVKQILRKLGATNRVEAVTRLLPS